MLRAFNSAKKMNSKTININDKKSDRLRRYLLEAVKCALVLTNALVTVGYIIAFTGIKIVSVLITEEVEALAVVVLVVVVLVKVAVALVVVVDNNNRNK